MSRKDLHTNASSNTTRDNEPLLLPWEGHAILLVDLDAFFASVEQLDHPTWRGKPVIVGGDPDKHGVVSAASYEARKFGVKSAMPSSMAKSLCPQAIWTHGHFDRYRELSNAVMCILNDETPNVQQVSIDEAFVDITPGQFSNEHPVIIAQRIQTRVEKLGITCSIGVGTSKTVAKIASDLDKPRGLTVVYPGKETDFLSPLPIACMSGIGPSGQRTLYDHGIKTLGELAEADESLFKRVFGKSSFMMRARCLGKDVSVVEEDRSVKSVSNEMTFATDLTTQNEVEAALATMAAKVGRRLRKKNLKGKTVGLKIRFSDRTTRSVQRKLAEPSNDELLFSPLLFHMVLEVWKPGLPVRLIGVFMSGFDDDHALQTSLFDVTEAAPLDDDPRPLLKDPKKRQGLLTATDKVRNRFGEDAVQFGRELNMKNRTTGSAPKNPADYREQSR